MSRQIIANGKKFGVAIIALWNEVESLTKVSHIEPMIEQRTVARLDERKRVPKQPLTRDFILSRFSVDTTTGFCRWIVPASKYRPDLLGKEAGSARSDRSNKKYWFLKLNQCNYKRAYLVYMVLHNVWPP